MSANYYYQASTSGDADRIPLNQATPLEPVDGNGVRVAFDRTGGYKYLCMVPSVFLPCLAPLFSLVARKHIESQQCTVTDRRVVFESGWLNHSNKSIPLDRIQDVNVRQDCVQACFGIKSLEIQTAGTGGGIEPEALLIAPVDAMMIRDVIMDRRDALVLGHHRAVVSDSVHTSHPRGPYATTHHHQSEAVNAEVVTELRTIRESLARLEAQVAVGMDHVVQKQM